MLDAKELQHEIHRTIRHKVKVRIEMIIRYSIAGVWSESALAVKGRVLDLATDGCRLFTKRQFDEGQELRLTIHMPWQPKVVSQAVVRWCKALPEMEGYASGVKFKGLAEKDLKVIAKFLGRIESKIAAHIR